MKNRTPGAQQTLCRLGSMENTASDAQKREGGSHGGAPDGAGQDYFISLKS